MPSDNPLDGSDEEFNATAGSLCDWLAAHFAELGLTAGQNTAIQNARSDWDPIYAAVAPAEAALATKVAAKVAQRVLFRALLAEPNRRLTDPVKRADAGLGAYATRRTRVPAPTTRPVLMVDTSQRFQHVIKFADETTPHSKAKPDGVTHLEIRWCLGPTPPTGIEGCTFLTMDTNTPYLNNIASEHAGKMAHYMARWVNSRNEPGPLERNRKRHRARLRCFSLSLGERAGVREPADRKVRGRFSFEESALSFARTE